MDLSLAGVLLQAFTAAGACVAAYAVGRVVQAQVRRRRDRIALGRIIDSGNHLMADYLQSRGSDEELDARYQAWEHEASRTVDDVDIALHALYHAHIPAQTAGSW